MNIQGGWVVKQLGQILQYEQPNKYIVGSTNYSNKGLPVLTANKSFLLGYTEENGGICKTLPVIILDDFTLLSKFVDFPFKVKSSAMKILRVRDDGYNLKFVYWAMQLLPFHPGQHKRYYLSEYQFLDIKVPSIIEQQAVVSVIEKWDKYIEVLDQKIQTKKNIKKYLTRELLNEGKRFGGFNGKWESKGLGEIGFFKTSSVDKKIREGERIVNLVNYMDVYRHKEISNISKDNLMKVSAKDQQIETSNLLKGDILFTPSSETPDDIGHSIVISEDLTNTLYSYHLVRFRPSITLDLGFSHYFCNQSEVLRQFTKYASGVTRFTLSMDSFSRVVVKIPPIEEQKAISSILSKSDEEIAMLEKQKEIIEEQRKYLINNLVTGEIRLPKFRNNK